MSGVGVLRGPVVAISVHGGAQILGAVRRGTRLESAAKKDGEEGVQLGSASRKGAEARAGADLGRGVKERAVL